MKKLAVEETLDLTHAVAQSPKQVWDRPVISSFREQQVSKGKRREKAYKMVINPKGRVNDNIFHLEFHFKIIPF